MTRMQEIKIAREMHAAGWRVEQIRKYLAGHDCKASWRQVKCWVDEKYADKVRRSERDRGRLKYRERHGVRAFRVLDADAVTRLGGVQVSPDLLLAFRVEDGLSYRAIAKVANRLGGSDLSEGQVADLLYELGAPKNPNKARPRAAA